MILSISALSGCFNDAVHACSRWCEALAEECPEVYTKDGCFLRYCSGIEDEDECLSELEDYYDCAERSCAGCFTDYGSCETSLDRCPMNFDR